MTLADTLVIFDCDGVLVDTEHIAAKIVFAEVHKLGVEFSVEQYRDMFLGRSDAAADQAFVELLGDRMPPGWQQTLRQTIHDTYAAEALAVDGVVAAIDELERLGAQTCVASSGAMEKMQLTLGRARMWDHFAGRVFSATQVERGKPAPDLFLYAANTMGFTAEHCVVVEDSRNGVLAAKAAHMHCVGYTGSTSPAEWLDAADCLIAHMDQLVAAVQR